MTRIITSLSKIAHDYDALFCDLWGCVHNGIEAFPEAVAALRAFKETGGKVVLVTNSPRPRANVAQQIAGMNVPDDCWDSIATSGDSARAALFEGAVGEKVYHIGIPEETAFFEPLKIIENPAQIARVPLEDAEGIVCTGPRDPYEDPSVYRSEFLYAKQKGLKLLCANPDVIVDRGEKREWCAGALAELYDEMGGESLYFGKPHPPIYDLARRRLAQIANIHDERILAIGDGPHTDLAGAVGEGIDSLFITGGIAAQDTETDGAPDEGKLIPYLDNIKLTPSYVIGKLR
ncbi:TIGR01459 family HAD-type hydrolase [Qingshengfaniella alkalisoli]|uniref:TIGR01459 family HAD-type hydrolase n=1 Tax=Qingshengfaniella alkalisoli TaxID=2599296 RepID=A0A5B8IS80_9RHOB|nr:TIGR01459 family HAD-type hydrolase [Qingshengfaniella alkalisoli]QDY68444.1 TIGR01459 family HAD-type hydrolase [Qingshengfaniella alkalisoli]